MHPTLERVHEMLISLYTFLGVYRGWSADIVYEETAQALVETLAPHYQHLISLSNTSGALWTQLHAGLSKAGPVTVFFPSQAAIEEQLGANFWQTWPGLASQVALSQVVYGWWPADALRMLTAGFSLQTVGGSELQVFPSSADVFLRAGGKASGAILVRPNVFVASGVVVVHETSALLLPPQLHFHMRSQRAPSQALEDLRM